MIKKILMSALLATTIGSISAQSTAKTNLQKQTLAPNAFDFITTGAQGNISAKTSTIASYGDSLWYFYSKHRFRNLPVNQGFYTITSVNTANPNGSLIEFGSSFLNGASPAGNAVTINGALILASRSKYSNPAGIPIKLYLYNATAAGVPTTKVDSVLATVTPTAGQFSLVNFTVPKTVQGSFFISYKNLAPTLNDTLRGWVNAATTATSTNPTSTKFGEGLSYTGVFVSSTSTLNGMYSNTDFYGTAAGNDYEAVIVPIVTFSINTNFTLTTAANSTLTAGAYCAASVLNFSNTSEPSNLLYNRQFNFNKFIPYWAPYSFTVTPNPADSITNWSFSSGPVVYTKNASVAPGVTPSYIATLTNKYRPSPRQSIQRPSITDVKTSTSYTIEACGPVGIATNAGFESFNLYPNPTVSGKTNITGLVGENTIMVYNMLGQVAFTITTNNEATSIDLSSQPTGNYFVRITNSNNITKTVKVINQ